MAQTMKADYAARGVYGSAAYDLNRIRELTGEEFVSETQAQPQVKTQTRTKAKAAAKPAYRVSAVSVLGVVVLLAVTVLILLAYVQLTEISAETTQMKNQLEDLQIQNEQLTMAYESTFNLNEIEEYATENLGLVKPSAEQVKILNVYNGDKAVILDSGSQIEVGGLESVWSFLLSLKEYF